MKKYLVSINDLPPDGKEFILDDQDIWLEPVKEFKMDCRIENPVHARIFVMPADEGCLVRGEMTGKIIVPCNRCTEDAHFAIEAKFDEFEEIPDNNKGYAGEESRIFFEKNSPMLNLAEIAWEQFMLAMPARPLCRDNCKGLCIQCGTNLNWGTCSCRKEEGDPRLEILRNASVKTDK